MEPVNKAERQLAIRQFLIFYGVSVLLLAVSMYALLTGPTQLLRQENERLRETLEQQTKLVAERTEIIDGNFKTLQRTDQQYLKATDIEQGALKTQLTGLEGDIQQNLYKLKTDTMQLQPENRRLARSLIGSFETALTYRNSNGYLRDLLTKNGIDASQMDKLNMALTQLKQENEMLKLMAAKGGGGGAPAPAPTKATVNCDEQVRDANTRLTAAQATVTRLEEQLKNASNAPAPTANVASKDDIEWGVIDRCEKKADNSSKPPLWRRPLYEFAIETLQQNERPTARQRIASIGDKLRKLDNN